MSESTQYSSEVVSTKNSSSSIVAPGTFFEGSWESVDSYAEVSVSVLTNQNGLLYLNFSNNGVDLLEVRTESVTASVAFNQTFDISQYKYFKVRFNNTGGVQSSFSLTTTYLTGGSYGAIIVDSTLPVGASTSALQQQQITEVEETNVLLEDIKTSTSTYEGQQQIIESIDNINQKSYNQNDLLEMILSELQEQTRILKKIYA